MVLRSLPVVWLRSINRCDQPLRATTTGDDGPIGPVFSVLFGTSRSERQLVMISLMSPTATVSLAERDLLSFAICIHVEALAYYRSDYVWKP